MYRAKAGSFYINFTETKSRLATLLTDVKGRRQNRSKHEIGDALQWHRMMAIYVSAATKIINVVNSSRLTQRGY